MKNLFLWSALTLAVCFAPAGARAQKKATAPQKPAKPVAKPVAVAAAPKYAPPVFKSSPRLQSLVNQAATETINKFAAKGFKSTNLAVTLIDLRDAKNPRLAEFNGEVKIYPASVVKMFYLAAVHRWLEDKKLTDSPGLQRAVKDMIVDSSNDATGFIVDLLTGTSNGVELPDEEAKKYAAKREAVNRFLASLDYRDINVNQKTYCESLYGRERQFWNEGKNRNMLTTNATARMLTEIVSGRMVTGARSLQMMELMKRDFAGEAKDPDDQAHGFTGIALKELTGARLWSKAGWTSSTRHDAAYVETPDGLKFVLVTFTTDFAGEREIIPTVASIVLKNLGEIK